MRWLTLYLRSRSIPAAFAALIASTAGLWALGHAIDNTRVRLILAVLAVAAGATAFGPGLAAADTDLDRTAAIAWPPRRAAHILIAAATISGILTATGLSGAPIAGTAQIARDVTGYSGLVALGTATLGAPRAWLLPAIWTMLVLPFTPPTGPGHKVALTWMIQPQGTALATIIAVVLGIAGALAYALAGVRRLSDR